MPRTRRLGHVIFPVVRFGPAAGVLAALLAVAGSGPVAHGQTLPGRPVADNPYRVADEAWGRLPTGRTWGAISAVYPAPDGRSIWVAERCGQNSCVGRDDVASVLHFDLDGNLLGSFGAGMIAWPHGIHVDRDGNVWITDGAGIGRIPEGVGHVVYKFSPAGELLLTLGRRGVTGEGHDTFNSPADVLVAPDGHIFVADGHGAGGVNRIMKFAPDGRFVMQWGSTGAEAGQLRDAHALAMDSQGRLFVADRGNSRIQIFDQDGGHIATWTQFGRPSGLFIGRDDVLYATDSESNTRRNPGWRRGIYIGSARDGWVTAFIPDPEPNPDASATSGAEGVAVDALGNVYGAEVGPMTLRRYVKR
jgi:DNA-binding beta-propeller fold protein YncE